MTTTPEVLRLLEGGNESPLAKKSLFAAIVLADSIGESETVYDRSCGSLLLALNEDYPVSVTIPSEVVTLHLGWLAVPRPGYSGPRPDPMHPERTPDYWDKKMRPAIVISTEGGS